MLLLGTVHKAATRSNPGVITLLLDAGADLSAGNKLGEPLSLNLRVKV